MLIIYILVEVYRHNKGSDFSRKSVDMEREDLWELVYLMKMGERMLEIQPALVSDHTLVFKLVLSLFRCQEFANLNNWINLRLKTSPSPLFCICSLYWQRIPKLLYMGRGTSRLFLSPCVIYWHFPSQGSDIIFLSPYSVCNPWDLLGEYVQSFIHMFRPHLNVLGHSRAVQIPLKESFCYYALIRLG